MAIKEKEVKIIQPKREKEQRETFESEPIVE